MEIMGFLFISFCFFFMLQYDHLVVFDTCKQYRNNIRDKENRNCLQNEVLYS